MITIYKYKIIPNLEIKLPKYAKILTLQVQNGDPFVWVLLETDQIRSEKYKFYTIGTGHDAEITLEKEYLGTFQLLDGLVFHVFYEIL